MSRQYKNLDDNKLQLGSSSMKFVLFNGDPDPRNFEEQIKKRVETHLQQGYVFYDIKEFTRGFMLIFKK
jgi:hypothetical protein